MLIIKNGNILDATEDYILHQTNCKSIGQAAGVAKAIFDKFPYANTYTKDYLRYPGTVSIHRQENNKTIINLYGQIYPGYSRSLEGIDLAKERENYFSKGLLLLSKNIPNLYSIAMPYGIGCGLAGGNIDHYMKMIKDFAERTDVTLYKYTPN